ncbi:hypothetical protein ABZP36_029819 [Zizania latifolia]
MDLAMEEVSNRVKFEHVGLRCFDGTVLIVRRTVAEQRSALVAEAAAAAAGDEEPIVVDVPGYVTGRVAKMVVDYWRSRDSAEDAAEFDVDFAAGLTHDERVDLICAAHHMADHQLFQLFRSLFGDPNRYCLYGLAGPSPLSITDIVPYKWTFTPQIAFFNSQI